MYSEKKVTKWKYKWLEDLDYFSHIIDFSVSEYKSESRTTTSQDVANPIFCAVGIR